MAYGDDYARFFSVNGQPDDPFPNPTTDAQRQMNARARARKAGVEIGSGYLNPQSGVLEDPDEQHWYSNPAVIGPLAIAGLTAGAALPGMLGSAAAGGASGATTMAAPGIPAVAGTGAGVTAPLGGVAAGTAAGGAGAAAAGGSALDRLRSSLTSPNGIAQLASLIPMLTMATSGGGGGNGQDSGELDRIRAITEARMRRADPLHQVAVQLAYGRAPVSARQGVALNNVRLPE
jgi:hypothetical protein